MHVWIEQKGAAHGAGILCNPCVLHLWIVRCSQEGGATSVGGDPMDTLLAYSCHGGPRD
jgi:hypothetical protein